MKQFFNVLSFELSNYFKNKGYLITTILISILLIIGLSLPSIFDMSKLIPKLSSSNSTEITEDKDKTNYALMDINNVIEDKAILENLFPNSCVSSESSNHAIILEIPTSLQLKKLLRLFWVTRAILSSFLIFFIRLFIFINTPLYFYSTYPSSYQ